MKEMQELIGDIYKLYNKISELQLLLDNALKTKPVGKWIDNHNGTFSCSECQSWIPEKQYHYARYCLHCGADMRNSEE